MTCNRLSPVCRIFPFTNSSFNLGCTHLFHTHDALYKSAIQRGSSLLPATCRNKDWPAASRVTVAGQAWEDSTTTRTARHSARLNIFFLRREYRYESQEAWLASWTSLWLLKFESLNLYLCKPNLPIRNIFRNLICPTSWFPPPMITSFLASLIRITETHCSILISTVPPNRHRLILVILGPGTNLDIVRPWSSFPIDNIHSARNANMSSAPFTIPLSIPKEKAVEDEEGLRCHAVVELYAVGQS